MKIVITFVSFFSLTGYQAHADFKPCAGNAVTCFVAQDGRNETFPGDDSCNTYFDAGAGKNMTVPYCSK